MERKRLPYGIPNFRSISEEGYVFIDKTPFLEKLESLGEKYIFFLRPRKFGKSLFVSMLEHYYDINHADKFERLFGDFYIGKLPTSLHNGYLVLLFDFSGINTETKETTFKGFLNNVKSGVKRFIDNHADLLGQTEWNGVLDAESPEIAIRNFLDVVNQRTDKKIYLLIDEYDHFANELLAFKFSMFRELVSRAGFVRKFYEVLKTGARNGIIDRMFITGVTPITLDSFTSGFNIGRNLSLDEEFHNMLGFTEEETFQLTEQICKECGVNPENVYRQMTSYYNGHKFCRRIKNGRLFNPDMVLYYLSDYKRYCQPPDDLIDANIASDYRKIGNLFRTFDLEEYRQVIDELMEKDSVYGNLTIQFNLEKEFDRDDFLSLLLCMGFITVKKMVGTSVEFGVPNYVIKALYYRYLYELIDQEYGLKLKIEELREAMRELAYQGKIEKLVRMVEFFLKEVLSNRDLRGFRENHLKVHILTLLHLSNLYFIHSELEIQRGYIDIFLMERPPFDVDYEWILELKYVQKEEVRDLELFKAKGKEQLERYMEKLRPYAQRKLMGALLIFSGRGECISYDVVSP